jgi:hypothetical protein
VSKAEGSTDTRKPEQYCGSGLKISCGCERQWNEKSELLYRSRYIFLRKGDCVKGTDLFKQFKTPDELIK